jgi:hypothetical protein
MVDTVTNPIAPRRAATPAGRRSLLTWGTVTNAAALIVFAWSPFAPEYPFAAAGIVAAIVVPLLLPSCRLDSAAPLCPANVAQILFWVQLVLVPILIGYFDISQGTLPRIPSREAIDTAVFLRIVAYVSFCSAYHYFGNRASRPVVQARAGAGNPSPMAYLLIVPYLGLGLLGTYLQYGSIGGFVEYISSPVHQRLRELEPTTLAGAASSFVRPFLGFAIVLGWSWWLGCGGRKWGIFGRAGITGIVTVLLLFANFSYNRGSMLAPLVALGAAYSVHVRRVSFGAVAVAGAVALSAAFVWGAYRSTDLQITEISRAEVKGAWNEENLVEFIQVYASGPQLSGFLVEELGGGNTLYFGRTLIPSVLYPVPVLGKPYRDDSGVAIFNLLIYGDPEVVDQVIPYDAELFMNFHVPGVVVGFLLLGGLVAFFQDRFLRADHAAESYAWFFLALWTVFPGSIPVASQMAVYFFWPLYGYFIVNLVCRRPRLVSCVDLPTVRPAPAA